MADGREQQDGGEQTVDGGDASRSPSAFFKMDDVQEDNVVPQSNFTPRIVAGAVVLGLIFVVLGLSIRIANQPQESQEMHESDVVYLDDETFGEQTASGIVLVDFYTDWCGPCQMMAPDVEKIAARFKGKAVVAKVNGDFSPRLVNQFRIVAYPILVLLKDGQEIFRVEGLQSEWELALLLDTFINQ